MSSAKKEVKQKLTKIFGLSKKCTFLPYKIKAKTKVKMQKKGFIFIDGAKIIDSNFGIKILFFWCKEKRLFLEVIDENGKSVFHSYR